MISQKDIADNIGLSQATVSRALKDDKNLPFETIVKVKDLAQKMGYKIKKHNTVKDKEISKTENEQSSILALISDFNAEATGNTVGSIVLEIIQGLILATNNLNKKLLVKYIDSFDLLKAVIKEQKEQVLGCVLIRHFPDEQAEYLAEHCKCISINHQYSSDMIKVIESSQNESFFRMYKYLQERGFSKIGFLVEGGPYSFVLKRYSGYLKGCNFFNQQQVNSDYVVNNNNLSVTDICNKAVDLYNNHSVNAFICTSGFLARKIIKYFNSVGINIPDDVSIVAFDELIMPMENGLTITGVQANYEKLSRVAIKTIEEYDKYENITIFSCSADFHVGSTVKYN